MMLKIFAVRDRASVSFSNQPMFIPTTGQAIRNFSDAINDRKSGNDNILNAHPEDFDLYFLGEYDTDTGAIKSVVAEQIAIGKDLVISGSN